MSEASLQVLLVDNENIQLFADWLRALGLTYGVFSSGAGALAWLEKHSADLWIIDLAMDEMDGLTLLRLIREKEKARRRQPAEVWVMSGLLFTVHITSIAAEYGVEKFIEKPFNLEAIGNELCRKFGLTQPKSG